MNCINRIAKLSRIRERFAAASAEAEKLTTGNKRRITPDDQLHFRRCISTDERGVDEIDRMLDDEIQVDPYVSGTNIRRSDKELARMLDLIDNLPISDSGKGGQA